MRLAFLAILLMTAISAVCIPAHGEGDVAAPVGADSLVIAEYDMLYTRTLWDKDGRSTLVRHPRLGTGPWFTPLNADWHEEYVREASGAGIDVLAVEWPVDADPQTMVFCRDGLARLVVAIYATQENGKTAPQICPNLTTVNGKADPEAISASLNRFSAIVPRALWTSVRVDGKPVGSLVIPGTLAGMAAQAKAIVKQRWGWDVYLAGSEQGGPAVSALNADEMDKDPGAPSWLLVRDWNNYASGHEGTYSVETGFVRADAVRVAVLRRRSSTPFAARFVRWFVPPTAARNALFMTQVTVRNMGDKAWTPEDVISLSYQWFRAGESLGWRGTDVMVHRIVRPGEEYTFNLGVATMRPGAPTYYFAPEKYELRFDMRVGSDAWMSESKGTIPLAEPVVVEDIPRFSGAVVATHVSPLMKTGGSYLTKVEIENVGSQKWTDIYGLSLAYHFAKVDDVTGKRERVVEGAGFVPVRAGGVESGRSETYNVLIRPVGPDGKPLPVPGYGDLWHYEIEWDFFDGDKYMGAGGTRDAISLVDRDLGAIFFDAGLPEEIAAGTPFEAKVFLRNRGSEVWPPSKYGVAYQWFYLDGRPAGDPIVAGPLSVELVPGSDYLQKRSLPDLPKVEVEGEAPAEPPAVQESPAMSDSVERYQVTPPGLPGVYVIRWMMAEDGRPIEAPMGLHIRETLCESTAVAGDSLVFVDLSKQMNVQASLEPGDSAGEGFDGRGATFDTDLLPPGVEYIATPIYPQSVNGTVPAGSRMMFSYPVKAPDVKNAVKTRGQKVDVQAGMYRELAILGASVAGAESGSVEVRYGKTTATAKVSFEPWTGQRTGDQELGFEAPGPNGPQRLYICRIALDPSQELKSITLPKNDNLRIVAITAAK